MKNVYESEDNTLNIDYDSIEIKKFDHKLTNKTEAGINYCKKLMNMSYDELVQFLLNKYGRGQYDYFCTETCSSKNKKVTRTDEGLYCHHIDEDKAILLSNDKFAKLNSFEYQKADRLVYCNMLEHFLLHILITEQPTDECANENEIHGIGGAVCMLCTQLNDLYNGYEYKLKWMINTTSLVKDDYESYILMLKRLWNVIKKDNNYSCLFSKEILAMGWDNTIYDNILKELG